MENANQESVYLAEMLSQLNDESMSLVDFDLLKEKLTQWQATLNATESMARQHAVLRDDYEQRMAGMVKAIAAVDRKRDTWQEALDFLESLPSLDAEGLIRQYRRVSARFRDSFPASHSPHLRSAGSVTREARTEHKHK